MKKYFSNRFRFPALVLGLLFAAWSAVGGKGFDSRFGFRTDLPEDWKVGAAALDDPGWGEMSAERRAAVLAALTPENGEVIMTGSPEAGFSHIEIGEEKHNLLDYPPEVLQERFAAVFAPWPDAKLEFRRIGDRPWLEARLSAEDEAPVLVVAYWQIDPERVVVFTFLGNGDGDGELYRAWRAFTEHIEPVEPNQKESAL